MARRTNNDNEMRRGTNMLKQQSDRSIISVCAGA
jgi:hypothetical protein